MRQQEETAHYLSGLSNMEEFLSNSDYKNLADVFRHISFKPLEPYKEHKHKRIEMAYVKRGSCIIFSQGESICFKQGEIMIITSDILHSFQAGASGCTLLQLEFPPYILNVTTFAKESLHNIPDLFSKDNDVMKIINNERIMQAIQRIVIELNLRHDNYKHLVIIYYTELFILINRYFQESYIPISTNQTIVKAVNFIRLNYHKELSITSLATQINVSDSYLRRIFIQHMNISPIDFLNQTRFNKAVELLRTTDMSIKEICYKCGFKSPQYFSRAFKQQLGTTPKSIRKSQSEQ